MEFAPDVIEECLLQPGELPLLLRLATVRGTSHWFVVVLSDPSNPLLEDHCGIAVLIARKRYTEAKARTLYARIERAIERADISALRKASRPTERQDEFLCWSFGLTSLDEALVTKELNDVSLGLARARDRGELDRTTYAGLLDRAETAIRLRRALTPASSSERRGAG